MLANRQDHRPRALRHVLQLVLRPWQLTDVELTLVDLLLSQLCAVEDLRFGDYQEVCFGLGLLLLLVLLLRGLKSVLLDRVSRVVPIERIAKQLLHLL